MVFYKTGAPEPINPVPVVIQPTGIPSKESVLGSGEKPAPPAQSTPAPTPQSK